MKSLLPLVIACLFAIPAVAEGTQPPSEDPLFITMNEINLTEVKWKKRPVVVFADTVDDPAFAEQMELLQARQEELRERDVVVITDTDPAARSDLRLKLRPRGFMLVLIGKDGGVKLRKPFPWDVREITRSIDKMPMRQREIREEKEAAGSRTDG